MKNNKRNVVNFLGTTNTYKGEQVGSMAYYAKKAEERNEARSFQEFFSNNYSSKVIKTDEDIEEAAVNALQGSDFESEYLEYLLGGKR
jgi:hypothetical protein